MICSDCDTDVATVLTTHPAAFLWECTACGWFKSVKRKSYTPQTVTLCDHRTGESTEYRVGGDRNANSS